jgi:alanyl-tRNA synthetase
MGGPHFDSTLMCSVSVSLWCCCVRFNDLDNIGFTGRHYSGFIMLGIQVFNKPNEYKLWMNESTHTQHHTPTTQHHTPHSLTTPLSLSLCPFRCVEFNFRWLTEELGIDKEEITFIEDVWAGGGNLGPSIEYFVGGLELGNMVFMQSVTTTPHTPTHNTQYEGRSSIVHHPLLPLLCVHCWSGTRLSLMAVASLYRCR